MNYKKLIERVGQRPVTKTADTAAKKKLRQTGDLGKVEKLTQLDRNKSKTVDMPDTADRMAAAQSNPDLAAAAGDVLKDIGWKGQDKVGSKKVQRDYNNPDQYANRVSEIGKEITGTTSDRGEKLEADPEGTVYPERKDPNDTPAARMAKVDLAGKDRITAADSNFDDAIQAAAAPEARDTIKAGESSVSDTAEYKHAYQPSGLNIKRKSKIDDEYLDGLIGGITDPDRKNPNLIDNIVQRSAEEDTLNFQPTKRDVEMHSQEGEDRATDSAYLTPEAKAYAGKMRKALDGQQSKKVQDLAFNYDVSDEMLDNFIDRFGQNDKKTGGKYSKKLLSKMVGMGAPGRGDGGSYGGDLGDDAKDALMSDGVYDYSKLSKDQKKQGQENRSREMIRNYLKQGGINAYAPHEGMRSILDMDLEHIKSLTQGGQDHPDNWVFASQNLNRLRGNDDLGPLVDNRMDQSAVSPKIGDKLGGATRFGKPGDTKKTFQSFFKGNKEGMNNFVQEFGQPGTKNKNWGVFDKDSYKHLGQDEVEGMRKKAEENYGMSPEQAKGFFPDKGRMSDSTYGESPDDYERDYVTNERDQVMYRQGIERLKDEYKQRHGTKPTNDEIKMTPKGKQFMKALKGLGPLTTKSKKKEEKAPIQMAAF